MLNFMTIRPVGAESFHAEEQTGRRIDERTIWQKRIRIFPFSEFAGPFGRAV